MNIVSAKYVTTPSGTTRIKVVLDNGAIMSVPPTLENIDYKEIMRQVEAGTLTIQDAD